MRTVYLLKINNATSQIHISNYKKNKGILLLKVPFVVLKWFLCAKISSFYSQNHFIVIYIICHVFKNQKDGLTRK